MNRILVRDIPLIRVSSRKTECAASAANVARDLGTAWMLAPRQDQIPNLQVTLVALPKNFAVNLKSIYFHLLLQQEA